MTKKKTKIEDLIAKLRRHESVRDEHIQKGREKSAELEHRTVKALENTTVIRKWFNTQAQ